MRKVVAPLVALAIMCLALSGCWGRREIENQGIVTAIGVDSGTGNKLLLTAAMAVPRLTRGGGGKSGSSSEAGPSGRSALILSAEGSNFMEAFARIDRLSARRLTTAHAAILILGEEFASRDISPLVDIFSRHLEFRPNVLVCVCQGKASEFLRSVQTMEESELSMYLSQLVFLTHDEQGMCPTTTMHELIMDYETLESDPMVAYIGLASSSAYPAQQGSGSDKSQKETEKKDFVAATVIGSAVFRKVGDSFRMVGILDPEESMGALILKGLFLRGPLSIWQPEGSSTLMLHHYSSQVSVDISGSSVRARYTLRFTASLQETERSEKFTSELQQDLVRNAEDRLRLIFKKTFDRLQSLGCDVVGLGLSAHMKFRTWQEWLDFNWPEKFSSVVPEFDVKLHLLNYGFAFNRANPR